MWAKQKILKYLTLLAVLILNILSVSSQNTAVKAVHPDARFSESILINQPLTGFSGIWYSNQPSGDEYVYKYKIGRAHV